MPEEYERGFSAGFAAGRAAMDMYGDSAPLARQVTAPPQKAKPIKRKMKRSSWHKYMKNSKNQIKFKRGTKKGLLDMKKMARNYRRSNK